ncbi:MAG: LysM peptidoglycan-binding domain-containing protein [Desulfobacterales bacterium]
MTKRRTVSMGIALAGVFLSLLDCSRGQVPVHQTPAAKPARVTVTQPAPPSPPEEPQAVVHPTLFGHTVARSGETLVVISLWYTGAAENWQRLVAANDNLNPRRIKIGDRILIPEELLKTRQPMPADFMAAALRPKTAAPVAKQESYRHTVSRTGETLTAISLWYTGAADNWKRLVDANTDLDPRRVRVGEKILIPGELVIKHRPMPANFMTATDQKKKAPRPNPVPAAGDQDRIELFGPVDSTGAGKTRDTAVLPLESIE